MAELDVAFAQACSAHVRTLDNAASRLLDASRAYVNHCHLVMDRTYDALSEMPVKPHARVWLILPSQPQRQLEKHQELALVADEPYDSPMRAVPRIFKTRPDARAFLKEHHPNEWHLIHYALLSSVCMAARVQYATRNLAFITIRQDDDNPPL